MLVEGKALNFVNLFRAMFSSNLQQCLHKSFLLPVSRGILDGRDF